MSKEHFIQLLHSIHFFAAAHGTFPTTAHGTFPTAAHGTFPKIDHILGHKESLSKYKNIEIIPCILSDHNTLKLELSNKNKDKKHANSWKLNNSRLTEQWVINEIKEEIKRLLEVNENETKSTRTCGTQKSQS
jgi:hypothetical protein